MNVRKNICAILYRYRSISYVDDNYCLCNYCVTTFDQRKLHLIFAAFIMSSMRRIVLLIKEELTRKKMTINHT